MFAADLLHALKELPLNIKHVCGDLYVDGALVPISPKSSHAIVHLREAGACGRAAALRAASDTHTSTHAMSTKGPCASK